MIRNIFIFLGTFVVGAAIALLIRAARFEPHAEHRTHASSGGEYAPMVSNALTPAKSSDVTPPASSGGPAAKSTVSDPHAGHDMTTAATSTGKPVNSICAICGMDVDPKVPTAQYRGKTIGFGCKMCPPKFAAEPDRYGPFYLRNEVIKK